MCVRNVQPRVDLPTGAKWTCKDKGTGRLNLDADGELIWTVYDPKQEAIDEAAEAEAEAEAEAKALKAQEEAEQEDEEEEMEDMEEMILHEEFLGDFALGADGEEVLSDAPKEKAKKVRF